MPRGRYGWQPADTGPASEIRERMLEALLCACSVALRIESPLLREMRLLLPGADAGLESDLRSHPEVNAAGELCALKLEHISNRMEEYAHGNNEFLKPLRKKLPELLRRHHCVHGSLLRASETYNLRAAGLEVPKEEVAWAEAVFRASNRSRMDEIDATVVDQLPTDVMGLAAWNSRERARVSGARKKVDSELASACALEVLASGGSAEPPEGINPEAYRQTRFYALREYKRSRVWQLRQHGSNLEICPPIHPPLPGTPLATIPEQLPSLSLVFRDKTGRRARDLRTNFEDGRSCPLGMPRRISVASDSCELELATVAPPHWVTRFGWDKYGLFADFSVEGVTFKLRWIPPGEFMMGSPEDEPGRFDREGPQHRVTIPNGFWMGATPVTQAQYAAVTGERPSYFKHAGDEAPVETVSWEKCQTFNQKLSEAMTDLDDLAFRLPTESEWEYACRAGTTTALYTGPLTIKSDYNGPEQDDIAWYGGNSGVEYEGGYDSSDWKDKQHDHSRAGTHPVREKHANPWGLYDTLGNVWEWCEDEWHNNYENAPTDGSPWRTDSKSSGRVFRGGGWTNFARFCRCACRIHWLPGGRFRGLGFRLVLSPRE